MQIYTCLVLNSSINTPISPTEYSSKTSQATNDTKSQNKQKSFPASFLHYRRYIVPTNAITELELSEVQICICNLNDSPGGLFL